MNQHKLRIDSSKAMTGETVKVTIPDASGHVADQRDNIAAPHVFVLEREQAVRLEIWSVTLDRASKGVL